ncbi:MAG: hypothetical protein HYS14_06690 [Candidatus Rokubacteria bacterium]|nr:hypothetical protein [Candidatus Rokubacteria bacterium]
MKIHLRTLGCPKNQVDSELFLRFVHQDGHSADFLTAWAM